MELSFDKNSNYSYLINDKRQDEQILIQEPREEEMNPEEMLVTIVNLN